MYLDMHLSAGVDGWALGPDAISLHAPTVGTPPPLLPTPAGSPARERASEGSSCHVVHERVEVSLLSSPKCARSAQLSVAEASESADGTTVLLRARLAPAMGPSRCSGSDSDSDSQASGIMIVYYPAVERGTLFSKNRSLHYPKISLSIRAPHAVVGQYANGAVTIFTALRRGTL
ncbi:hypothetical protein COCVIDRAFT_42095 [Bipolaris victoriae FI3]|uniref:Uncharacterized protein n=1 Tax=Bipolaris victoriae (strain FI3) TaxID=930091 RepID=W7E4H1_BIPV3|nr:hypothetical protein COCVIDRAFT_42095 [Bipolaris victoriae FI3]